MVSWPFGHLQRAREKTAASRRPHITQARKKATYLDHGVRPHHKQVLRGKRSYRRKRRMIIFQGLSSDYSHCCHSSHHTFGIILCSARLPPTSEQGTSRLFPDHSSSAKLQSRTCSVEKYFLSTSLPFLFSTCHFLKSKQPSTTKQPPQDSVCRFPITSAQSLPE